MKPTKELKEQRGVLQTELTSLAAKMDAKTITTEEEARMDVVMTEITALNPQIEASEARDLSIAEARKNSLAPPATFSMVKPTDNEAQVNKEFRFNKIILDMADKRPLEGFYKEMNQEGKRDMKEAGVNMNTDGFVVPAFIIGNDKNSAAKREQRDLAAPTTGSGGGYTIATDLLAGEWIDALKNSLVTTQMGSKFLSGLQGSVAIPRKTTMGGANWLTETGAITLSDFTHDQVAMSPKRLGNATRFSRQLLIQASLDIERIVREDLVMSQALALQDAAIKGPSTGNGPLGILNTSGIGSVVIGTNGGALTWAAIVALETAVANANAMGDNCWYLTNTKLRGAAKTVVRDAGSGLFLWGSGYGQGGTDFPMNGYRAAVTGAVPSTNVKGSSGAVCSSLIFGDFSNLIYGQWGGLVLTANPYANDLEGQVRVVANAYYDIDVRHAESFAACNDITT